VSAKVPADPTDVATAKRWLEAGDKLAKTTRAAEVIHGLDRAMRPAFQADAPKLGVALIILGVGYLRACDVPDETIMGLVMRQCALADVAAAKLAGEDKAKVH